MKDKRIKMDCPFCGHDKSDIQLIVCFKNLSGTFVEVKCPECGVKFTGYGKENIINKWNRRV